MIRRFLLFLICCSFFDISAQTISWTGNGDGISWGDPNNWNTLTLPTNTDDVLISVTDPAKDSVTFTLASATIKSLTIGNQNWLRIAANTSFSIKNASQTACDLIEGNLINRGTMLIDTAGKHGVYIGNKSSVQNLGYGIIATSYIDSVGIFNEGELNSTINAEIDTWRCHVNFVRNTGNFINAGRLETGYYANAQGFYNIGSFVNSGVYYHSGGISVLLVTGNGQVNNTGTFSFVGPQVHSIQLMGPDVKFVNNNTGRLSLNGLLEVSGGSSFTNKNYIENTASTVVVVKGENSTFNNDDSLYIYETNFQSVVVKEGGVFNNNGVLVIDSAKNNFNHLIDVDSARFVNNGTIEMNLAHKSPALQINHEGFMLNNGIFNISNLGHDAGSGVISYAYGVKILSGKLQQNAGAELNIDSATVTNPYYYTFINYDTLVNNGLISIKRVGHALWNFNGYIENAGTILLNKIGSVAYSDLSNAQFINSGTFDLRNIPLANNVLVRVSGSFNNTGRLRYLNAHTTERSFWSTGHFYNNGLVDLQQTENGEFTSTDGFFFNDHCGIIRTGVIFQIFNAPGTPYVGDSAVNHGVIINKYVHSTSFAFPSTYLINRGLFINETNSIDFQGENTGYISRPLSGPWSAGIAEKPIFIDGGAAFPLMPNFYFDSLQTHLAGSFANNALTAAQDTSGAFSLYFKTDFAPECESLTYKIQWSALTPCSTTSTNTFTATLSQDWFTDANWDTGKVPDYCSNVVIPSSKKVIIPSPIRAKANKITAEKGSVMSIETGSLAEILNSY